MLWPSKPHEARTFPNEWLDRFANDRGDAELEAVEVAQVVAHLAQLRAVLGDEGLEDLVGNERRERRAVFCVVEHGAEHLVSVIGDHSHSD